MRIRERMADINPQTTFHLALTEKEYNLVMMGLAVVAGAPVKPNGQQRKDAATLNVQLLVRAKDVFGQRVAAIDRKLELAPVVDGPEPGEEDDVIRT